MTTWPNFFLAGAPKAGTTALYEFLRQHPQVYVSPIKEPTYFAAADLAGSRWAKDVARFVASDHAALIEYLGGDMQERRHRRLVLDEGEYLTLFRPARGQSAVGEASVSYFWLPGCAGAIARRVPQARILFLLRHPAERAFSQYLASAFHEPAGTFRERFELAAAGDSRWSPWIDAGRYGANLGRFYAAFPREQIRVFLYEDYRRDTLATMREVFTFLGVDRSFVPDVSGRHNEPAVPRFPTLHRLRYRLLGRGSLTRSLPDWLRRALHRMYLRPRAEVQLDPVDRQMVADYFRDETLEAAALIGRDLSQWLR